MTHYRETAFIEAHDRVSLLCFFSSFRPQNRCVCTQTTFANHLRNRHHFRQGMIHNCPKRWSASVHAHRHSCCVQKETMLVATTATSRFVCIMTYAQDVTRTVKTQSIQYTVMQGEIRVACSCYFAAFFFCDTSSPQSGLPLSVSLRNIFHLSHAQGTHAVQRIRKQTAP